MSKTSLLLNVLCIAGAAAMQFELPAELLQGGYGGVQMQQQQQEPQGASWPRDVSDQIEESFEWLGNTEWKGKTATYGLQTGGILESSLQECKEGNRCAWSANRGKVYINTPTLGVIAFEVSGTDGVKGDAAAFKRLGAHNSQELKKCALVAIRASRNGKRSRLMFHKIMSSNEEDDMITKDLYKVLEIPVDEAQNNIKRKYRRLSATAHPDKCKASEKDACNARFDSIRQAYEILSDPEKREYYNLGGIRLVRNMEGLWKEVEGQKAQLDAQLQQVPHNHPMRAQVEHQVAAQKQQLDPRRQRPALEQKMTSEESDHHVPVTLKELFHGTWNKAYDFPRLVICRGCRDEPDSARCQECGRCPPEKKQVPQFANTPFGRQVVGHKDKMVESLERCGEETLRITGLKIGRGARPGTHMKSMDKVGHQTPGRLPGKVNFKLAYAEDPVYRYVGNHLYTVLSITLAEALYGFEKLIPHVDGKSVFKISRQHATPGEVFKVKSKGMFNPGSGLGDVYIRLKIALPIPDGNNDVTVSQGGADTEAILEAESMLEERAGGVWRRFSEAEEAVDAAKRQVPRTEL